MERINHTLRRLRRDENGAALVEFAIMLPLTLVTFAMIIEGSRLMWSYQATAAGVRDAARYLARVAPATICANGGSVATYSAQLKSIIENNSSGNTLFPSGISVTSVTPSLTCVAGTFRISPAPVAQVQANLQITFPFASVFDLISHNLLTINTTVTDQARIFGT